MKIVPHAAIVLVLFGMFLVASRPVCSTDRLLVAVSIVPLGDFTRNVGGDRIDVKIMVPAGSSPHIYEPSPAKAKTIANAMVLVLNGVGLEFWADKLIDAANNPNLIVVETAEGLEIIKDENGRVSRAQEGDHVPHNHGKGNPHVWLDPINAVHQIGKIRDALIQADPEGARLYRRNADRYTRELMELDAEIRKTVATFVSKKFVSFHSGFAYFARRYGLEPVAVVEKTPGREPSPKEIIRIVKTAKEFNIKAVFAEPQFPPKAAQVVAEEAGAEVLFLNPLGDPPDFIYLDTMRKNLSELSKALKGGD